MSSTFGSSATQDRLHSHLDARPSKYQWRESAASRSASVKLIIGIDYGTSFSGAAYTLYRDRPTDPRIEVISDWQRAHQNHLYSHKVPSDIAYDENGIAQCGAKIPPGAKKLRWVKLLLETDPDPQKARLLQSEEVLATRRAVEALGKSPIEVAADYLEWLWSCVQEHICDIQNDVDILRNADVTVVMTVPAMWSDAARDNTAQAAEMAGLASEGRKLKFLTEPEAAAIFELERRIGYGQILRDDCVIICDAGGGTVDLVSYQVKNEKPLELDQKVVADGDLCGSVYIDEEFVNQVIGILQDDWAQLPDDSKEAVWERFATTIKPSYEGDLHASQCFIQLFAVSELALQHLPQGRLVFDQQLVRFAFENVMPQICSLIDSQEAALQDIDLRKKLKGILLVGGLGSNRFVQRRIEESYPRDEGVKVWRGMQSWTSVVQGAVRCEFMSLGRIQTVNARLSRWNYGIRVNDPYNPTIHRPQEKYKCSYDGTWKARQIVWLVKKAQVITPMSAPETYSFVRIVKPEELEPGQRITMFVEILQSGVLNAPNYNTEDVKTNIDIKCTISSDILRSATYEQLHASQQVSRVKLVLELHMLPAKVRFVCKMSGIAIGDVEVSYRQHHKATSSGQRLGRSLSAPSQHRSSSYSLPRGSPSSSHMEAGPALLCQKPDSFTIVTTLIEENQHDSSVAIAAKKNPGSEDGSETMRTTEDQPAHRPGMNLEPNGKSSALLSSSTSFLEVTGTSPPISSPSTPAEDDNLESENTMQEPILRELNNRVPDDRFKVSSKKFLTPDAHLSLRQRSSGSLHRRFLSSSSSPSPGRTREQAGRSDSETQLGLQRSTNLEAQQYLNDSDIWRQESTAQSMKQHQAGAF